MHSMHFYFLCEAVWHSGWEMPWLLLQ